MTSDNSPTEGKSNLDAFFEMFDWVDEDISELNEKDENQVGGYECLFIAFNNLKSFPVSIISFTRYLFIFF